MQDTDHALRQSKADQAGPEKSQSLSDMALVSVVIPCYNQAHYLREAIESVLGQSYPHFEIIVVDDGSSDNTSEVAAGYPGVSCIRQDNQGLAGARNAGLRESRGEYLVFLDADDRLLPGAVEVGLNCLSAHPECAFVSGHYRYIKEDGEFLNQYSQKKIERDHYSAFLRGNYIGMHATVMYRRAPIEKVDGFNPSLPACEDYDLYLRLAKQFPVSRHQEVVAEYRRHSTNMSGNPELMLKTSLAVLRAQKRHINRNSPYQTAYRAGINFWQKYYGSALLTESVSLWVRGKGRQAARKLIILLRYAPRCPFNSISRKLLKFVGLALRTGMPVPIYRRFAQISGLDYHPSTGEVNLGDLRRLTPLSRTFGYDRGLPIDRYYIENFLSGRADDIRGRVLEIGDDSYTRQFGGEQVTKRDILHAHAGNPRATFVGDLASADGIPSDTFDCIILTQTLHLIYDLRSAIQSLNRILKPGGVLLATVPGISQTSIDEWADSWYWAFTILAAQKLFSETFDPEETEIRAHGNVLAATAFLNGLATGELRKEELDHYDPHYQLLITIRARK